MRVLLCQHVVWANKQERRQRKVTAPGRHPCKWYPQGRTRFPISKVSSNLKILSSLTPTKNFPMLSHYFQKGVPVLSIQPTAIMGATHRMSSCPAVALIHSASLLFQAEKTPVGSSGCHPFSSFLFWYTLFPLHQNYFSPHLPSLD